MQDYLTLFGKLRGKIHVGIAYDALQNSWCDFIRHWNRMLENEKGLSQWLSQREDLGTDHSIGALRERYAKTLETKINSATTPSRKVSLV